MSPKYKKATWVTEVTVTKEINTVKGGGHKEDVYETWKKERKARRTVV